MSITTDNYTHCHGHFMQATCSFRSPPCYFAMGRQRGSTFRRLMGTLGLIMLSLSGCAKFDHAKHIPWSKSKKPTIPSKVLPIWSDTVLHQKGQPGVRGFGGRVLFYDERDDEPIKVDGSLTIYAFDAELHDPSNSKPEMQFVITADQLDRHYGRSKLGHSYSIWLPWDIVGGPSRQISLVAKFEGREGGVAISDPATKMLPGVATDDTTNLAAKAGDSTITESQVRPTSYGQTPDRRASAIAVDTIEVPPSFTRHLRGSNESLTTKLASATGTVMEPSVLGQGRTTTVDSSSTEPGPRMNQDEPVQNLHEGAQHVTRFEPTAPPDQTPQFVGSDSDPIRRQPHPAKWPSALPPTPRSSPRGIVPQIRKAGESMFRKLR